jgi:hypothetical protein
MGMNVKKDEITDADLKRNLKRSEQRPHNFNPLTATSEELLRYGLPRRPAEGTEKSKFDVWEKIVTGKPWALVGSGLQLADYRLVFAPQNFPGTQETSQNWSGVVTRTKHERAFNAAYATFQVPWVDALVDVKRREYRCSVWVGLDGHDPTSQSMPQLGITMKASYDPQAPNSSAYEVWFQWWSRKDAIPPIVIDGFPVNLGDNIACWLDVIDPTEVLFVIQNQTLRDRPTFTQKILNVWDFGSGGKKIIPEVRGITAEWIAERPMMIGRDQRYHLPIFDRVTFSKMAVQDAALHDPGPVRTIRMVRPVSATRRLEVISRSRRYYNPDRSTAMAVGPGVAKDFTG